MLGFKGGLERGNPLNFECATRGTEEVPLVLGVGVGVKSDPFQNVTRGTDEVLPYS